MGKPILLTVDDDPQVLSAVERDLRREYGGEFRVLKADSGAAGLQALQRLKLRNEPVALFLVDQRMPHMTGVEFLEQAMQLFPSAKRVLLTAYADTEAAIRAINRVGLDHYLLKPWDPPDQNLYPILNPLLDDWHLSFRPPFEGIRLAGTLWSPASHRTKDFLARNQVPYQWLDVEVDAEARQLAEQAGGGTLRLPVVLFPDGSHLIEPSNLELAERIGLQTHAEKPYYDLVIVGSGPAGLAAAVYGSSEGLRVLVIDKDAPGGQAAASHKIENLLGFPSGLSGADLARRGMAQALRFGTELLRAQEVTGIRVEQPYRVVTLGDGAEVNGRAVLIASGAAYKRLIVPGSDRFNGAGVYYGAASTEASFYRDQEIAVIGGANSAAQGAMYLSRFARHVTMLIRGPKLVCASYLQELLQQNEIVEIQLNTELVELTGDGRLEGGMVRHIPTGETRRLPLAAVFVFIGLQPRADFVDGVVQRDEQGFVVTGQDLVRGGQRPAGWPLERDPLIMETSVPGVFAAGDVRRGATRRVGSAIGEGSIATMAVHEYLKMV